MIVYGVFLDKRIAQFFVMCPFRTLTAKMFQSMLFLLCCSAKPLLGHHALVWLLGFRMAGFMLSGSGIRVFVLGNMGLGWGGWGKVQINDGGGWRCGRDGVWTGTGWWCILLIGGA